MSNTYRNAVVGFCCCCDLPRYTKTIEHGETTCECRLRKPNYWWDPGCYWKQVKVRDHKPWYKPPAGFKQMRRQQFRAQVKQALHNHIYKGKEFTPPINKKSDVWCWM